MSSIPTTSTVLDSVRHALSSTRNIEDMTSQSGVFRMRQHFVDVAAAPYQDPIPSLRRARNEANFIYPLMTKLAEEKADCPELNAYSILCRVLNSIPACAVR